MSICWRLPEPCPSPIRPLGPRRQGVCGEPCSGRTHPRTHFCVTSWAGVFRIAGLRPGCRMGPEALIDTRCRLSRSAGGHAKVRRGDRGPDADSAARRVVIVIRRQRRCKHDLTQRFHRACMLFGLPMVTALRSPMCMSLNGSTRNGRSSTTVLVLRSVAVVESQSPTIRVVLEAGHVLLAALADARADILLRHVRNAGLPPVRRDSERHLFRPADRLAAARGAGSASRGGLPREVQAATASAGVAGRTGSKGGGERNGPMFNGLNIGPAMKRCTFFLLFEFPVPFYGCAAYLAKNGCARAL